MDVVSLNYETMIYGRSFTIETLNTRTCAKKFNTSILCPQREKAHMGGNTIGHIRPTVQIGCFQELTFV